jgi:hypothetical protein
MVRNYKHSCIVNVAQDNPLDSSVQIIGYREVGLSQQDYNVLLNYLNVNELSVPLRVGIDSSLAQYLIRKMYRFKKERLELSSYLIVSSIN